MGKSNLIKIKELKKELQTFTNDDLILLITDITKSYPKVKEFLTAKFLSKDNIKEVFENYKQTIKNELFLKRGLGKLRLSVAKKAISDFSKISPDKICR